MQICDLCLCLPNENVLDRQSTGEGKSKHYKQVSHGATLIFDDVFNIIVLHHLVHVGLFYVKSLWGADGGRNTNIGWW